MGKWQNDAMLDAGLNYVSSNATEQYACTAQPTDRANAIALSLTNAETPSFTGPANGDTSGRKITCNQVTDANITASGTVNHIALCDGATLLYVTTTDPQTISSGGQVTIPEFDIELGDAQ